MTDYTSAEFWKGAPEGATHYCAAQIFKGARYGEHWLKPGFYRIPGRDSWIEDKCRVPDDILVCRPSAPWSGEGLPPIGITCRIPDEMASGNPFLEKFEGVTAHIIAHTASVTGSPLAVFWYEKPDGSRRFHALAGDNGNFEPIKTQAQIAAEEREAAVRELAGAIMGHAIGCRLPMSESGAERLADHLMMDGYTKTKGDDK